MILCSTLRKAREKNLEVYVVECAGYILPADTCYPGQVAVNVPRYRDVFMAQTAALKAAGDYQKLSYGKAPVPTMTRVPARSLDWLGMPLEMVAS